MATEKRLIDANALMTEFRVYLAERYDRERCSSEENCNACERECLWKRVVKNAPTVEAVEVVHGRWITDQVEAFNPITCDPYPLDVLQCSACGEYFDVSEARNYCPNCGAKMDGDGNV